MPRPPLDRSRPSRAGLAWLAPVLASLAPGCGPGEAARGAPGSAGAGTHARNAILISIDTLRPDHLGCSGYGRETSPLLDSLAVSGVRFSDVTAAAPWTLPSHATMLTGLYPSQHGVKSHETSLPESVVTVAEDLERHGFETIAVVNSLNVGAPQFRLAQGFRRFQYISETDEDARTKRVRTFNMGGVVLATAREMLEDRDAERPFFLFLHFYDVHSDFTPKEEFRRMLVEPYEGRLDGRTQQLNGVRNRGQRLEEADLRFLRQMYDAEIRTLDELLQGFFAWLDERGLREDTLVIVTSDHGEEFQEHGGVLHGRTQYQELLRIPLILCGPGVPSGTVIDTPVHGVDIVPTLLAGVGVTSTVAHDGLDLAPLWRGQTLPERLFFGEADRDSSQQYGIDNKLMVRRGWEKLIHDRATQRSELYDLLQDPGEQRDLAPGEAQRVRELGAELARFRARAVQPEMMRPPSDDERRQLDAMGYGGGGEDDD